MSASGKKKKAKGKTLNLNEFLSGDTKGGSAPAPAPNYAPKQSSWLDEMENASDEDENHGSRIDRSILPTAPRAARGPDIPLEKIPTKPPFTAYLGNLPYDVSEEDISRFFKQYELINVRLPSDGMRMKGFGYAEFTDRQSLIEALSMSEAMLRNRKIKIDLASSNQGDGGDGRRDNRRRDDEDDRTQGDWRKAPRDTPSRDDGYDRRDRYDRDSRDGDRYGGDRYGDRDGGGRRFGSGFGGGRDGDRDRYQPPRDRYEEPKERPRLALQPRTKPIEEDNKPGGGGRSAAIFGDAKPVDIQDRVRDDRPPPRDDRPPPRDDRDRDGYRRDDRRDDGYRRDDRDRDGYRRDDRGYDRDGGYRRDDRRDDRGGYDRRDDRRDDRGGGYDRRDDRGYGRDDRDRGGYRDDRGPPRDGGGGYRRDDRDSAPPASGDGGRRRLNLQPRTKPKEETGGPTQTSSIFGGAKPVDTAAKEKEIEERISRQREQELEEIEREKRLSSSGGERAERGSRSRNDSSNSIEGSNTQSSGRQRKSSSSSGKGIRTVAPPPGVGSARVRRDSTLDSDDENVFENDSKSKSSKKDDVKLVPAPPPTVNIWEQRKSGSTKPADEPKKTQDNAAPPQPKKDTPEKAPEKSAHKSPSDNAWSKRGSPAAAPAPTENVWAKRKQEAEKKKTDGPGVGRGTPRRDGAGRGRGGEGPPRERKEKPLPKSIDEMPKAESGPAKDFSDSNKFAGLLGDDDNGSGSDKEVEQ